ncbi:hypothetical protein D3C81_1189370 [compost metagenome]
MSIAISMSSVHSPLLTPSIVIGVDMRLPNEGLVEYGLSPPGMMIISFNVTTVSSVLADEKLFAASKAFTV